MIKASSLVKRAVGRVVWSKPESLWIHYGAAIVLALLLVVATHLVNRTIIGQGALTAQNLKMGYEQLLRGQQIEAMSADPGAWDRAQRDQLEAILAAFEAAHDQMAEATSRSVALQNHYFAGERPFDMLVKEFMAIARALENQDLQETGAVVQLLQQNYERNQLDTELRTVLTLQEEYAGAEIQRLTGLQKSILIISSTIISLTAVIVFLPAHLTVKTTLKQLRHKTEVLGNSQFQLRAMNEKLNHLVNHDPLTGLPNRACMMAHLVDLLSDDKKPDLGVLFMGLDNFKTINDAVGHAVGDQLLIAVGTALRRCVDDDDMVARVGGDEFILMTSEPPEDLAKRMQASLVDAFDVDGRSINVGSSIGYLTAQLGDYDPGKIIANAGIALQAAKNDGGDRSQAFTPQLRNDLEIMQQLQMELPEAIRTGQIEAWFQPQILLESGQLHGAEVLARWRHPTRGLLTPDRFFPAAERAGLTIDVDHAIWRSAMQNACMWQTSGIWRPCISLNAAPDTISDPNLVERLLLQLQRTTLELDQVVVEVLETTLIDSSEDMAAINIDSLAECGISLELDDFGTGYASLSKLTQLPLAGIKLDRSLIAPLPDSGADSIVRAILALATELGLRVVAEGIEEQAQAEHLNARGCALGQGYGFARPMPAEDFSKWLKANEQIVNKSDTDAFSVPKRA